MKEIHILLVDDHQLFLEGIKTMLDGYQEFKVIADANDGEEVFAKLKLYYIDIIILDIQMPRMNGMKTAEILKEKYPEIKILTLSMHNEKAFIEKMFFSGVDGYLLKNTTKEELVNAIRTICNGGKYFSPDIMSSILHPTVLSRNGSFAHPELSKREIEILALIARELSNPQIAEQLHLSIQTINTHRKNLLRKLNVKNTAGLVKYALNNNLA